MIGGKEVVRNKNFVEITEESILAKTTDYTIISYYLGEPVSFKKDYHSPFRSDKRRPNLRFFLGSKGAILFKDFACGLSGNWVEFVKKKYNLGYNEALRKVYYDLGLDIGSESKYPMRINVPPKEKKLIQIVPKPFTLEDHLYWKQYELTYEELNNGNTKVFSIEKLYLNKQLLPSTPSELRFAYQFDQYLKIYTPYNTNGFKWMSTTPNDYISGFDDIKYKVFSGTQDEKLIISKSVKDEKILRKFFKDVCSTQNESPNAINRKNLETILKGYKPNNVYIMYDSDTPGVEASLYFTKNYGFNYLNTPKIYLREDIKDWADLVKFKGLDTMANYLKIKNMIV